MTFVVFFYFKFELLPSSNLMFWPVEIFAIFVLMLALLFFLYISSGKISWQKSEIFIVIRSRLILTFDTLTLFFFFLSRSTVSRHFVYPYQMSPEEQTIL